MRAENNAIGAESRRNVGRPRIQKLDFDGDLRFQQELRLRVDEYFCSTGRRKRDCRQMYLKTAVILACLVTFYVLLVFVVQTLWLGLALAVMLALCVAAVGFNIQHDGGHRAYSEHLWLNRLMAWTLDLMGSSSQHWHWKHTVIHHRYVNITGYDNDADLEPLGRYTPHQPWHWYHRWQHLYLWLFYGLLTVKMQFVDDFQYVITGRLCAHRVPRPRGWDLVIFVIGKGLFLTWAFVVPMLFHPVVAVLFYYAVIALVLGNVMVLVFVVAHLVDKADFPIPMEDTGRMTAPWAIHQARTSVNFARRNPILTWLLGGLNYQKEHHLFPSICHVNYPGISKVVEDTCREFGVPYHTYSSFLEGVAAHYRWLRHMGRGDQVRSSA